MPVNKALALGHITCAMGERILKKGRRHPPIKRSRTTGAGKITILAMTSGLHAIKIHDDGTLSGSADPRREGVALGYSGLSLNENIEVIAPRTSSCS